MAKRKARRAQRSMARGRTRKTTKGSAKRPMSKKAVKKRASSRRRRPADEKPVPTPPSSLNMNRRGSAARSGRAELQGTLAKHRGLGRLTGGDVDADLEQAYFTGDEAPGGDNPTPDQEVVEELGEAVGLEYRDNEELGTTDKVSRRDKHRWELDPASSEDYKDRR